MNGKVIKPFTDKTTNIAYPVGSVYESNSDRIAFLQKEGYLEAPEKPKRTRKQKAGE